MNIDEMNGEQLDQRLAEIRSAMTAEDADITALTAEVDAIEARRQVLAQAETARRALANRIAAGEERGQVVESGRRPAPVGVAEVRNSTEYVDAFARYIKSGDATECRKILTMNADSANVADTDGQLPVPEFVDSIIRTAWENESVMSLVRKTELKGNITVGFERSATDAEIHAEGAAAPAEEQLLLGIVTMVPATIKKWITFSTEVYALNGESFLRYIYSEIAHKVAHLAAKLIISDIITAATTTKGVSTATVPAVALITGGSATTAQLIAAEAQLSDEAENVVAVMLKTTEATIKTAALAANYAFDPFDGLSVINSDAVSVTESGSTKNYMIVGDFSSGVQANFPDGYGLKYIFDELSLAEKDLIKVVGRMMMGHGVVAPGRFTVVELA